MPYDLFISYARRDNTDGRVTELVERIADDYRQLSRKELRYFFDVHDIHGMDDWLHTILEGLKESQLFLLVLSPAYLKSKYCEWEIVEYLKYESARAVSGEGIAPIYVVTIPGLDEPGFRSGRPRGSPASAAASISTSAPGSTPAARPSKAMTSAPGSMTSSVPSTPGSPAWAGSPKPPGNLPAHNPRFVGRETEMSPPPRGRRIGPARRHQRRAWHRRAGQDGPGHPVRLRLRRLLPRRPLAGPLPRAGTTWPRRFAPSTSTSESSSPTTRSSTTPDAATLRACRAAGRAGGAAERAGEPNPPQPRTLLILDNIDDARLLQPPHTDLLSGCSWLHVLATTRLGPEQLSPDDTRHRLLPVDELPEDDALRLIASYQPQGRFASDDERAAAREIVTLLQGFTLAVEVVAVHLAERGGRLTCAALRDRLKAEGLTGLENVAGTTTRGIPHVERLVTVTLRPDAGGPVAAGVSRPGAGRALAPRPRPAPLASRRRRRNVPRPWPGRPARLRRPLAVASSTT